MKKEEENKDSCTISPKKEGAMAWNTLDVTGLKCPVPIMRASRVIQQGRTGDIFEIIADDSEFEHNIKIWCKDAGLILNDIVQFCGKTHAIVTNVKRLPQP